MKLEVSLSPSGDIRLHIPMKRREGALTGNERTLDISATEYGVRFLQRILKDAASGKRNQPGYIGTFPTQAVLDAWAKEFKKKHAEEDIAAASERLGVDLTKVEISL